MRLRQVLSAVMVPFFLQMVPAEAQKDLRHDVEGTMLAATRFMVEEVSTNGGYVWNYYEDMSRRWGELEAYKSQIWVQGSTPRMGMLFLDAYDATGNEYYYEAAEKVARALTWGQLRCGGWNYMIDFAGTTSMQSWYKTIGKNGWGFEELNYFFGNATFDDRTTVEAAEFLLRVYLQKLDPSFKPALDRAIDFFLESQYPIGAWPQRYPLKYDHPNGKLADYTSFLTLNGSEIQWSNIEFLIKCLVTLGDERFRDPILRGMNFFLVAQQGNPQGGWAYQYTTDLKPAHARTYEPAAISPNQTYVCVRLLMRIYEYTGDRKFLARIPDALRWLEDARLPTSLNPGGKYSHALYVEVGTNKPLFAHRRGSNVSNGTYWVDHSDKNMIAHLGQKHNLDLEQLRKEYERIGVVSSEEISKNSPLRTKAFNGRELPQRYFTIEKDPAPKVPTESDVLSIITSIDSRHRWLTKHARNSAPYSVSEDGTETNTALACDPNGEGVSDPSDQQYVQVSVYMRNMTTLINYVKEKNKQ